ncbi:MAG: hypothetical protein R2939_17335 [Kofleriaceae bacterium]
MHPGAGWTVTMPPAASTAPACAAAAHSTESVVYTSVPHTAPATAPAHQQRARPSAKTRPWAHLGHPGSPPGPAGPRSAARPPSLAATHRTTPALPAMSMAIKMSDTISGR